MSYNIIIGTNAGICLLIDKANCNIVIGNNSGNGIKNGSCNFIFGDDIPGEDKDNQFIISKIKPDFSLDVYENLFTSYPKICHILEQIKDKFTREQIVIIKRKIFSFFYE